jgi:heme exporter protein D
MTLPAAHVGHYLWVLYVIPILVVAIGIVRTLLLERRRRREGEGR